MFCHLCGVCFNYILVFYVTLAGTFLMCARHDVLGIVYPIINEHYEERHLCVDIVIWE